MKVSHKWLQSYFDENIPDIKSLADIFTFHSFEVEELDEAAGVMDVKVLPDRACYALSHVGVAEEIYLCQTGINKSGSISSDSINPRKKRSNFIKSAFDFSGYTNQRSDKQTSQPPKISIKISSRNCNRYMAMLVEGLSVGESPAWLKEELTKIGAKSINSIVDTMNFVMFDRGQPLHAFDADLINGGLEIRLARAGETITTLDGKEVVLEPADTIIADEQGPLAIAGIKGGKRAEVTKSTKNIIIESANFNSTAVRKTSSRIGIKNDSSKRFENSISVDLTEQALAEVCALIMDLCEGSHQPSPVFRDFTDLNNSNSSQKVSVQAPAEVSVDIEKVKSVIGIDIPDKAAVHILEKIGCTVGEPDFVDSSNSSRLLKVRPPSYRLDLKIEEDFIEEIARIYGLDKIKPLALPSVTPTPAPALLEDRPDYFIKEHIKNILAEQSFDEVFLYTLGQHGSYEVTYPQASDKNMLRTSLIPHMTEALIMNGRNADLLSLDRVMIFEIGHVFPVSGEKTMLCLGLLNTKKKDKIKNEEILKKTIENLQKNLKINENIYQKFIIKQLASSQAGQFPDITVAEIDLDALIAAMPGDVVATYSKTKISDFITGFEDVNTAYKPISVYPFIVRDVAVFVPGGVSADDVQNLIASNTPKEILARLWLFDSFAKDGKQSYAFRMVLQSMQKTLSDDEANSVMDTIYAKMEEKGWVIR